jgi:hypothetical protein
LILIICSVPNKICRTNGLRNLFDYGPDSNRKDYVMTNPEFLGQLIEQASSAAGSDYRLAQLLEVPRQNLSAWKNGRKSCPVGDVVLMAEIAGLPAEEWAARAVVAQYEGTSKGDKLFRALGKALPAIGAAIVSSGANAHQIFSPKGGAAQEIWAQFIRCIEVLSLRRFRTSNTVFTM